MDLSIRVIALILFATRVASHQGTHTYRLSKFLKIKNYASKKTSAAKRWNYLLPMKNRQGKTIFGGPSANQSLHVLWLRQKRRAL